MMIVMAMKSDTKHSPTVNSQTESQRTTSTRTENLQKYPHLDPHDPLANMTEEEIIREQIDLTDSILTNEERKELHNTLKENRQAFSLTANFPVVPISKFLLN